MGTDAAQELRAAYRADKKLVRSLNGALDRIGFDQRYVQGCVAASQAGRAPKKTKYIKDNVWGMIEVDWRTMRLIDSPILQRLRSVHQLGVSYLTYPSAEHSRFIHSIGMSSVVRRFLEEIDKRPLQQAADGSKFDSNRYVSIDDCKPVTREDIIHAAILHDIGHFPFSHATEFSLIAHEDEFRCGGSTVAEFRSLAPIIFKKKISLSESIALLIILSERFEEFYLKHVRSGEEDPDSVLRIACLVAGAPIDDKLAGVSNLISSTIDADKIDYVNRDARGCGIPVGIDTSRIFLRTGLISVTEEQARPYQGELTEGSIVFVVNASGVDTLDEITQARASLYQRVYLHPVTRAAEVILARSIKWHASHPIDEAEDISDALSLWAYSDDALLTVLRSRGSRNNGTRLARKLNSRFLPKKACAFSAAIAEMHMPLSLMFSAMEASGADTISGNVANGTLRRLTQEILATGEGDRLAKEILSEVATLTSKIPKAHTDLIPKTKLDNLVIIGRALMDPDRENFFVLQNGELVGMKDFTRVVPQQDASDIYKGIGYVMCDPEWRALVLVAARVVLGKIHGRPRDARLMLGRATTGPVGSTDTGELVQFVERMILDLEGTARRAGVPMDAVDKVMKAAARGGYFNEKPVFALPISSEHPSIQKISDRLSPFDGERAWRVKPETVAAFINQFPPALREPMLKRLASSALKLFDTEEICSSILSELRKIDGDVDLTALSPGSGNVVRAAIQKRIYKSPDWTRVHVSNDMNAACQKSSSRPLVVVDDNISSGVQSCAQLLAWGGVPRNKWPKECQEEENITPTPLLPASIENLRARPITLIVCAGQELARKRLDVASKLLNLKHPISLLYRHKLGEAIEWPADLKKYLREVGTSLLAWSRRKKPVNRLNQSDLAWCRADAFGYRNAGGLIATATNVPTSTVTALWCPGMHNGQPWMPLLIRSHKLRHLVVG